MTDANKCYLIIGTHSDLDRRIVSAPDEATAKLIAEGTFRMTVKSIRLIVPIST